MTDELYKDLKKEAIIKECSLKDLTGTLLKIGLNEFKKRNRELDD